jgi:hypothetical protein
MTGHLEHPLVDGVALGVVASLIAAAAMGWAVAYRIFGPRSRHSRRPRAASQ